MRTRRETPLFTAALTLAVAMAAPATALAQQEMTGEAIIDAVDDELLFDPAVPSNNIDVGVVDGVVTLTGSVNNLLAKDRATRIAETVKGVKSVINRIDVHPTTPRPDAELKADVEAALLADPAADSYEVDVAVDSGEVTLTGTVESWAEKSLAAQVAKGVRGATAVQNRIDVRYAEQRTDSEIRADIERSLRWNTLVDDALIDVQVSDSAVTLTGTVGSAAEKRRADTEAWVAGVKSVDATGLHVERWARDEDLRKDKYAAKTPAEIEDAIVDALMYDPRVASFKVRVQAVGSTVTLRGTVDNLQAKRAAGQVARSTAGVTYVTNRLKVRPADRIGEEQVAERVRQALLRDPYVERYDINVAVIDGTAYLSGTVDTYFEKGQADDVAAGATGVVEVRNNLDVRYEGPLVYEPYVDEEYYYGEDWYDYEPPRTFMSDENIREEIVDELWWSPFVDSDDVTVTVDDGAATLTGTVESWSEREAATENAYEGGAVWVDNELSID